MLELLTELFHFREIVSEEERNTTGFREEVYRTFGRETKSSLRLDC